MSLETNKPCYENQKQQTLLFDQFVKFSLMKIVEQEKQWEESNSINNTLYTWLINQQWDCFDVYKR